MALKDDKKADEKDFKLAPPKDETPVSESKPADAGKEAKQAGDGGPEIGQQAAEDGEKANAGLVSPQAGQPQVTAEDPRGDSPRRVAPAGFVVHGVAGADHPNQPVQPTRYAFEMTQWLGLPEAERAKIPPPQPPEGFDPHPLAVQPSQDEVDQGKDLGRKQVVLK
jgi:hypothetical protein